MSQKRFLAVGECMIELSHTHGDTWRQGFAGDTLNAAWTARALLPESQWTVDYFTRVGNDSFSTAMTEFLSTGGIETRFAAQDEDRRPGLYTIETDEEGERSFSYWRENSAARRLADDPVQLKQAFEQAHVIYLSGITCAILPEEGRDTLFEALTSARNRGLMVCFDPNLRPVLWESSRTMLQWIEKFAAVSDVVLPTFEDDAAAFGDLDSTATRERYRALGCGEVVVRNGIHPLTWHCGDEGGETPVRNPVSPVDTTGAGDSFSGAYLAARILGLSPGDAIGLAQRVSALVVRTRGALAPQDDIARFAPDAAS